MGLQICLGTHIQNIRCCLQCALLRGLLDTVCFTACGAGCSLLHSVACLLQSASLPGVLAAVCFTACTKHIYMLLASTFLWMDMLRCLVIRPVCGATLLWMANQLPPHAGWGRPYTPHMVSAVNVQL